jgi:hypothetical protein
LLAPVSFWTLAVKVSTRLASAWRSRFVDSPTRLNARPISLTFASATLRVRASRLFPSLTRASNTFAPSSCVFENAPRPACQICCAESRTIDASWSPARSAPAFRFFAMSNSFRRSKVLLVESSRPA